MIENEILIEIFDKLVDPSHQREEEMMMMKRRRGLHHDLAQDQLPGFLVFSLFFIIWLIGLILSYFLLLIYLIYLLLTISYIFLLLSLSLISYFFLFLVDLVQLPIQEEGMRRRRMGRRKIKERERENEMRER